MTILADLDELVRLVRDDRSRTYIAEAVRAYRAGALRASIISTWIAVVFDVQLKIRILAAEDDKKAIKWVEALDSAMGPPSKVPELQKIERETLDTARSFEFITRRQSEELARLQQDRRLCAHPGYIEPDTLFEPSPEQCRTHIVHAVQHLLSQAPVHGKAALTRVKEILIRPDFPQTESSVRRLMNSRFLDRGSSTFIKNCVEVLMKSLIKQSEHELIGHEDRLLMTLDAFRAHSPGETETAIARRLGKVVTGQDAKGLSRTLRLIEWEPRCWSAIEESDKVLLIEAARQWDFRAQPFRFANTRRSIEDLRSALMEAFNNAPDSAKIEFIADNPGPELAQIAVDLLQPSSRNFRSAEHSFAKLILPMAGHFSPDQICRVVEIVGNEEQLNFATEMPKMIAEFFDAVVDRYAETIQCWDRLLEALNEKYGDDAYFGYPELRTKVAKALPF